MKRIHSDKNKAVKVAWFLAIGLFIAGSVIAEEAPLFHINPLADSVANAGDYVGGGVTKVTGDLGAPSAAWFNPSDNTLIDYIYIGESQVITFYVTKEGKRVTDHVTDARSAWESGVCPAYPKCPV